ncbi:LysR substrate-binding domain-containing protein [Piscinibacter sakaiensis]|uniref:LysR substrate-binding domain-containing protein n=1 Tax=Piscinibacter sakaiensis TaxID=1547922 RepID=UPI003AB0C942
MTRIRRPPLDALRAFESAARHRSFVRAADELNVTAAAISLRIRTLESSLGVALFERLARGVVLTDEGRRYAERIATAMRLIESSTEELCAAPLDGPLRISAPQSLLQHWLLPRLASLVERHPGLRLSIEGSSRLADLRSGATDVALRFGSGSYPGVDVRLLMGDVASVLSASAPPANQPLAEFIGSRPLIHDESVLEQEPWSSWSPWLREAGVRPGSAQVMVGVSDASLALAACRAGVGLCIARASLVIDEIESRALHALMPWRTTEFGYHVLTRHAEAPHPRIAAFLAWLTEQAEQHQRRVALLTEHRPASSDGHPSTR